VRRKINSLPVSDESLADALAIGPSPDEIDELNLSAERLMGSDPVHAGDLARQALAAARLTLYQQGEALASFILGVVSYYGSDYSGALEFARTARNIAMECGDRRIAFRALNLIGGIQGRLGDSDAAMTAAISGLKMAEEDGDRRAQAAALMTIALQYRDAEEYDKAQECLEKALELEGEQGHPSRVSQLHLTLGTIYSCKEDFEKALRHYQRSLSLLTEEGLSLVKSDVLTGIGIALGRKREYNGATACHREALEIRRARGDRNSVAASLKNLGYLAYIKADFDEAILRYSEALEIAESLSSKNMMMRNQLSLMDIYAAKGEFEEALKHARIGMELADELRKGALEEGERRIRAQLDADRARAESELQRIRIQELAVAQRLARVGSWRYHHETGVFEGSHEFFDLLEVDAGEMIVTRDSFLSRIHPHDRDQLDKELALSVRWKNALDLIVRGTERRDGKPAIFHLLGRWERWQGEETAQFRGMLQNIAHQLEADDMRREKERLQGMLEMAGAFTHEMNQPMQLIMLSIDLLMGKPLPKELDPHLQRILGAIGQMTEISARLSSATRYRSKEYIPGVRISDIDWSDRN